MAEEISHPSPLEEISLNTGRQSGPRCIKNNQFGIKLSFVSWAMWSQLRQRNNRIFSTGLNLLRL